MSDCRRHNGYNFVVIHRNAAREFESANWALQRLAHDAAFKNFARKQLGVVIRMIFHQILLSIIKKASKRFVAVTRQVG